METRPQISTGPHGICSLCGGPIAIGAINIAIPFRCPNCGRTVRASKTYEVLGNLCLYALPIVVLFHLGIPILFRIFLYPVLAVAIGFTYVFVVKRLFVLRFKEFREPDEELFQSLNLKK